MDNKNRAFPQYRKLSNGQRLYCIASPASFSEIQLLGSKRFLYKHEVSQYPEILLLRDMMACQAPYEMSSPEEWQAAQLD